MPEQFNLAEQISPAKKKRICKPTIRPIIIYTAITSPDTATCRLVDCWNAGELEDWENMYGEYNWLDTE